ncbi:MAG: hypothetical protein RRA63_05225 [Candidatus Calescibacterium sp.]|nr:hypothetical protein [Candidatus Calescibacterium sp.]
MRLQIKIGLEDNSAYTTFSLKIIKWEILKRKFVLDQLISENLPYLFLRLLEEKKEVVGTDEKARKIRKIKVRKTDYFSFLKNLIRKKPGKISKIIFFVHKDSISDPDFISALSYIQALFDKKIKIIPSEKYELQVEFDVKFLALISSIIPVLLGRQPG